MISVLHIQLKKLALLFIAAFISVAIYAQQTDAGYFSKKDSSLSELYNQIYSLSGNEKLQAELTFRDSLKAVLLLKSSLDYNFSGLKKIGKITSDDGKIAVYTWNIPQPAGFSNYYGLIQYFPKKNSPPLVYSLKEKPELLAKFRQYPADTSNWTGSLYYQIITTKFKGETFYTLLGFNFNTILSNIKLIEVLAFDENDKPYFPLKLFQYDGKPQNRIVFEYNEKAQMNLEYKPLTGQIVFDHLSPYKPSLEGQFQFYGPDFSYDGFIFEDGKWIHQKDIRVTN